MGFSIRVDNFIKAVNWCRVIDESETSYNKERFYSLFVSCENGKLLLQPNPMLSFKRLIVVNASIDKEFKGFEIDQKTLISFLRNIENSKEVIEFSFDSVEFHGEILKSKYGLIPITSTLVPSPYTEKDKSKFSISINIDKQKLEAIKECLKSAEKPSKHWNNCARERFCGVGVSVKDDSVRFAGLDGRKLKSFQFGPKHKWTDGKVEIIPYYLAQYMVSSPYEGNWELTIINSDSDNKFSDNKVGVIAKQITKDFISSETVVQIMGFKNNAEFDDIDVLFSSETEKQKFSFSVNCEELNKALDKMRACGNLLKVTFDKNTMKFVSNTSETGVIGETSVNISDIRGEFNNTLIFNRKTLKDCLKGKKEVIAVSCNQKDLWEFGNNVINVTEQKYFDESTYYSDIPKEVYSKTVFVDEKGNDVISVNNWDEPSSVHFYGDFFSLTPKKTIYTDGTTKKWIVNSKYWGWGSDPERMYKWTLKD